MKAPFRSLIVGLPLAAALAQNPPRDVDPVVLGRSRLDPPADGFPYDLVMHGRHAVVAEGQSGLQIIDVTDPNHARRVGSHATEGEALAVAVQGEITYTVARRWDETAGLNRFSLEIFDLSSVANPRRLGGISLARLSSFTGLSVSRGLACAVGREWLEIVDVSNPAVPKSVCRYEAAGSLESLTVAGEYAYLTGDNTLEVIDISDPANLRRMGSEKIRGYAYGLAVRGHVAYLVTGEAGPFGLEVFEIADPTHPRRVGGNSMADGIGIALSADHVLVAHGQGGLTILNAFVPLRLEPASWNQDNLNLRIGGPPDWPVRVQRGTDLTTWQDWRTVTLGKAPVDLTDPEAASQPRRFYRAIAP